MYQDPELGVGAYKPDVTENQILPYVLLPKFKGI